MVQNRKLLHQPLVDIETSEIPGVDYKIALSPAPDLETDNAHPLGRAGDRAREVLTNLSFVCPFS